MELLEPCAGNCHYLPLDETALIAPITVFEIWMYLAAVHLSVLQPLCRGSLNGVPCLKVVALN